MGVVLLIEVKIVTNVKVEFVFKFCYLGNPLGAGGGIEEASGVKVRFA